jgi:hypothetical protein
MQQPTISQQDISRVTALIRAMYLGQKVMSFLYSPEPNEKFDLLSFDVSDKAGILSLRPLSSITDDEAIQVAKIVEPFEGLSGWWTSEHGRRWANQTIAFIAVPNGYLVYQYLIQRGFALPFYDAATNHTFTVEEQIELGIIKLT